MRASQGIRRLERKKRQLEKAPDYHTGIDSGFQCRVLIKVDPRDSPGSYFSCLAACGSPKPDLHRANRPLHGVQQCTLGQSLQLSHVKDRSRGGPESTGHYG